ncbi:glucose-induced degradation protein 8 homolog isoform X2 [Lutra lutra]|uniref:glucose-induced degradation protein 8 homolog isoform X2 n=1 Tax=Lutra lutra TaxID=9657 RepID=UPI001FCFD0AD|nr:glucose-induced degradation protein 8 homolog isoform X2 [Lutra lutra]
MSPSRREVPPQRHFDGGHLVQDRPTPFDSRANPYSEGAASGVLRKDGSRSPAVPGGGRAPPPPAGASDWLRDREPALSRSRGRCLEGRPSVRLPSRSPPPPSPRLPPPLRSSAAHRHPRLGPAPRAAAETAQRGRRDPHGQSAPGEVSDVLGRPRSGTPVLPRNATPARPGENGVWDTRGGAFAGRCGCSDPSPKK